MHVNLKRTLDSGEVQDIELKGNRVTVGRDQRNHLTIAEDYVSARHAIITLGKSGEVLIEDCESRNGTFVNKMKVNGDKQILKVGDIIRFAYVDYEVVAKPPANAIPVVPLSDRKK